MARPGGEQRYFTRAVIPELITRGFTIQADIVRELGRMALGGYRRPVLLGDIREFMGLKKYEAVTRAIGSMDFFPKTAMVETSLRQPRKYRVFATMDYTDLAIGEKGTKEVSWYDDRFITKEESTDGFIDQWTTDYGERGLSVDAINIFAVEHNEDMYY